MQINNPADTIPGCPPEVRAVFNHIFGVDGAERWTSAQVDYALALLAYRDRAKLRPAPPPTKGRELLELEALAQRAGADALDRGTLERLGELRRAFAWQEREALEATTKRMNRLAWAARVLRKGDPFIADPEKAERVRGASIAQAKELEHLLAQRFEGITPLWWDDGETSRATIRANRGG